MTFKKKVLSVDGGGIRGIIPATIIAHIEKKTGKPIAQLFDLISGTSTGGILSLALTKPNWDGSSEFAAKDIVELYRNHGSEIFCERLPGPLDELIQAKYGSENRESILKSYLGDTPISAALTGVFITSYDIELRIPVFFVSRKELEVNDEYFEKICDRYTMLQAAMATSAAPTFFPPYPVQKFRKLEKIFKDGSDELETPNYALVDGGAFANNPASLALMEVMISHKIQTKEALHRNDVLIVSLGTGSLTRRYRYEQATKWGQLKWMLPFIDIVFDSQSEAVACQLDQLLVHDLGNSTQHYFRYQELLRDAKDNMDDASQDNIDKLEKLAANIIDKKADELDYLCSLL
jgi:patatin-like phospholipase/acyl hydrolase